MQKRGEMMGEIVLIVIMAIAIIAGLVLAIKTDNGGGKNKEEKTKQKGDK